MIIREINLSYPCIKYEVSVSHFTARKSTAIEWVILESIRKASMMEKYLSVPVATLFSEIFTISDADLLIRPCLLSLQDMGALIVDGVDDETELSTVPMRNLRLTSTGEKMQRDGLLPGDTHDNKLEIYYDVTNDSISQLNIHNCKAESTGLIKDGSDDLSLVNFPYISVKALLEEKKKEKKKGKLYWLMPTTTINDIQPVKSEMLWRNIVRKVDLKEGLYWSIQGNTDEELDTITLMNADLDYPEEYNDLNYTDILNPDKEIKKMIAISDVRDMVLEYSQKDDLFFVRDKYYAKLSDKQLNHRKKTRIAIVTESEKFEVNKSNNQIIIRVPELLMQEEIIYQNEDSSINIGKFKLSTKDFVRDAVFAYTPVKVNNNMVEMCMTVVNRYFEEDNSVLILLLEMGLKDMYLEYADRLCKKAESVKEKSEIIEQLNALSFKYCKQKYITSSAIEKIIINEDDIISTCSDISGFLKTVNEYGQIASFKQNDSLYQKVLRIALDKVNEPDSVDDVWKVWDELNKIKKSYVSWISNNNLYKGLYTNKIIRQIFDDFSTDKLSEIKEYTVVEKVIKEMKKILESIQEKLPEIQLTKSYSDEYILEAIMSHKDELSALYECVRRWKDEIDKFETRICEIEQVTEKNSYIQKAISMINRIADSLKIFFDDAALKYKKVYILDTCTLMNQPGVISWFEDGKSLLIIPQVVLSELDGLKESDNSEKAYNAREAIRVIDKYKGYDWFNISEESHQELLSKDLDPDKNDNKILSIAVKYSVKRPILLSDDTNFRNIAASQKIDSMDLKSFENMKSHERLESPEKSKKKKKKKKK